MPFIDLAFLQRQLQLISGFIQKPDFSANGRLFIASVCSLGTDASPNDEAPDELGCAETVDTIFKKALGIFMGGGSHPFLSTTVMYTFLLHSGSWIRVGVPVPGCIVISPTGYGTNPAMPHGHVGYISTDGRIMSNTSADGKFMENYTLDTWRERYVVKGGYPMHYYKRV